MPDDLVRMLPDSLDRAVYRLHRALPSPYVRIYPKVSDPTYRRKSPSSRRNWLPMPQPPLTHTHPVPSTVHPGRYRVPCRRTRHRPRSSYLWGMYGHRSETIPSHISYFFCVTNHPLVPLNPQVFYRNLIRFDSYGEVGLSTCLGLVASNN